MRDVADAVSPVAAELPTDAVSTYLQVLDLATASGPLDPALHELAVDAIVNRWSDDDPRWDLGNPKGVPGEVFEGIEGAILADRHAYFDSFLADFNYTDLLPSERVGDGPPEPASRSPPDRPLRTVRLCRHMADGLPRGPAQTRRPPRSSSTESLTGSCPSNQPRLDCATSI